MWWLTLGLNVVPFWPQVQWADANRLDGWTCGRDQYNGRTRFV